MVEPDSLTGWAACNQQHIVAVLFRVESNSCRTGFSSGVRRYEGSSSATCSYTGRPCRHLSCAIAAAANVAAAIGRSIRKCARVQSANSRNSRAQRRSTD